MTAPQSSEYSGDPRLARLWAGGVVALLAVTWRLWMPLHGPPRIPAMAWLCSLPVSLDYLLLSSLLGSTLAVLFRPQRRWLLIAAGSLACLMSLDQFRWQAWAYHLLVMAPAIALLPAAKARYWLRLLTVTIYLFAAEAKLDVVFLNTMGQQLVDALTGLLGVDAGSWPQGLRLALAATMPVSEAVIGLMLLFNKTRRPGVIAAIGLHTVVAVALSPLGLGHQPGVILWNVVFAGFVWLSFWERHVDDVQPAPAPLFARPAQLAIGLLILAMLAPLTRPLGIWDRWPSWGLYAPQGERAAVFVHGSAADRLPTRLPLDEATETDRWRRVHLDEWMLTETGAPLYPQNRTNLGLALGLNEKARLGSYLKVEVQSAANRFSGARTSETLLGGDAVQSYCKAKYWLNTKPQWTR